MQEYLTRQQRIRNLLMVIGSAMASASLLSWALVHHYGPTGSYFVRNTLLDPELVHQLTYSDSNPKTGGTSRFVFEEIKFSFFDRAAKEKKVIQLSQEEYGKFYRLIMNDKSLPVPTEDIQSAFSRNDLASLAINARTESQAAWQQASKPFQQVDILPDGDFYRIELRSANSSTTWAYFYHPHLLEETLNLLKSPL